MQPLLKKYLEGTQASEGLAREGPTHRPDQPTSRYDYFVRDGNAAVTGRVDYLIHLSDHWPVNFTF
jgi:hypothetical protein